MKCRDQDPQNGQGEEFSRLLWIRDRWSRPRVVVFRDLSVDYNAAVRIWLDGDNHEA